MASWASREAFENSPIQVKKYAYLFLISEDEGLSSMDFSKYVRAFRKSRWIDQAINALPEYPSGRNGSSSMLRSDKCVASLTI